MWFRPEIQILTSTCCHVDLCHWLAEILVHNNVLCQINMLEMLIRTSSTFSSSSGSSTDKLKLHFQNKPSEEKQNRFWILTKTLTARIQQSKKQNDADVSENHQTLNKYKLHWRTSFLSCFTCRFCLFYLINMHYFLKTYFFNKVKLFCPCRSFTWDGSVKVLKAESLVEDQRLSSWPSEDHIFISSKVPR